MSRALTNNIFIWASRLAVIFCGALLTALLGVIVWKGVSAISPSFLFTPARNFGAEGGILYQILGTLLLISVAALLCFPVALGTAIFRSEYLKSARLQRLSAALIYGLNGVPSIIFGVFGLIFFVNILDTGISWSVGSLVLAMMILPTVTLAAHQSMHSIPEIYRESAKALGLDKWQIIVRVLLPQSLGGATTGLFLGLARAVGETAPLMFIAAAFSGADIPGSLWEPVATLPTHILELAQQATNPKALSNAWGASFVLICLVLALSAIGLFLRKKLQISGQR